MRKMDAETKMAEEIAKAMREDEEYWDALEDKGANREAEEIAGQLCKKV